MDEDKKVIWDYLNTIEDIEDNIKIDIKKKNLLSVTVYIPLNSIFTRGIIFFNIKNKNGLITIYDIDIFGLMYEYKTDYELNNFLIKNIKPIIRDNKLKRLDIN